MDGAATGKRAGRDRRGMEDVQKSRDGTKPVRKGNGPRTRLNETRLTLFSVTLAPSFFPDEQSGTGHVYEERPGVLGRPRFTLDNVTKIISLFRRAASSLKFEQTTRPLVSAA